MLKKHLLVIIVSLFSVSLFAEEINLFERKNLSDWGFYGHKEGVNVGDAFSFTPEGTLKCQGEPFGFLATSDDFQNFRLALEYRWPEGVEPTNSGIFLRMNAVPEKTFLPRCAEVQLKHGDLGDIWGFHGMKVSDSPLAQNRDGGAVPGKINGLKKITDTEKKEGEWNNLEILCEDGVIIVIANGKLVNWATNFEQIPGKIGFQSEGGPIEFRNAVVEPLDKKK
ncbi:MAG: 3-keto-disaccharide hydrolase [Thermoguttaceae bacterium]